MIELFVQKRLGHKGTGSRGTGFFLDAELRLPDDCRRAVFFGPSGSGKTLTLRAMAGLLRPDSGRIRLGDEVVFDSAARLDIPARQRRVGYMFQDYALFPHLSVEDNVAFAGMRVLRRAARGRAREWLEFFRIDELAKRRPAELSAGQRQRAALARAVAAGPRLLLLDEPFSALDPLLRGRLRLEFRDVLERLDLPVLLITHDPADVEIFADYLAVFRQGRVSRVLPFRREYGDGRECGGVGRVLEDLLRDDEGLEKSGGKLEATPVSFPIPSASAPLSAPISTAGAAHSHASEAVSAVATVRG